MRETANKPKYRQSNLDFTANVRLYMFSVIPFAPTVSVLVVRNDLPLPSFYCLQHKISLPKSKMSICVPVFDAFSLRQPSIHLKCVLHNCHCRESFHL